MKKVCLAGFILVFFSTTALAIDVAISTQAGWFSQGAADREMQEIVDAVTMVPVEQFTATDHEALADWVVNHTGDGAPDLLILCGQLPATLYAPGNTQPDGSLVELFLDDGNCIINTGDWIFYVVNGAGTNGTAALPNIMDIPSMDMWDDDTPVTVTDEGQQYTPSLTNFSTDRAIHLNALTNDWYAELILALAADGNRADPIILHNSTTGGRIGIFFQTSGQDNDPRGEVISEWINNWYLVKVANPTAARNPSPPDGAVDVPRDTSLSWTPSELAAAHDVYLGPNLDDVSAASRANSMDVLAGQAQSAVSYAPSAPLDFSTTYYWRVDEVNGAPDNTVFPGVIWSFTTEPYSYPIESVVATSNGVFEDEAGPENTVNGSGLNASDQHSTESTDMWLASPGDDPLWIQFQFDHVYQLHQMLVWNYNVEFELILGFGIKDVAIEYSTSGQDWTTLGDAQLTQASARRTYAANSTIDFGGVAAQYVRLNINSGFGSMGQYGLSEVRFRYIPVQAREPQPIDGANGVDPAITLSWRAGRAAASHEVYLGADPGDLTLAATVDAPSYAPADLHYGATYSWRVDEVNEAQTEPRWEGPVWSFSTAAYGVVDDMDSYTDDIDAGTAIFQTWIDGWENDNGALVGYFDAPFAERTIVHGGRQSMPLEYDNTASPNYSEAVRTFDPPQDWTAHGVRTLGLYFRGAPGNSGQLYVRINGTKVDYDGDPDDLAGTLWLPWNIDLSAVGADLGEVTELAIGIEGAGSSGMLYIDDIRVYPKAVEYITPTEPDAGSLVARYGLDGNANDSSGHGYDGTAVGSPTYVTGVEGQAIQLNGTDQYVNLGNPSDWPAGRAPRSLAGWGKPGAVYAGWRWIASYGSAGTGTACFIGMNGTDLYGGGYGDDIMLAGFWEMDEWHHATVTYDGTTAKLYADGIEVASAPKNWNLPLSRAVIGQQVNDFSEFWVGSIDDVRVYNRALSPDEVAWLAGRTMPMHKSF